MKTEYEKITKPAKQSIVPDAPWIGNPPELEEPEAPMACEGCPELDSCRWDRLSCFL